ncbi:MAG: hypothetical protein ACFB50_11810 [Rubrobacteraceae bacterium]
MTEQDTTQQYRECRHEPEGSLWMDEPTNWRGVPAVDWELAAHVLSRLANVGDDVGSEALVIALMDARFRCQVEGDRARERESSEGVEYPYSPDENARVRTLLRRVDTLGNAKMMIEDCVAEASFSPGSRQQVLSGLDALRKEADEVFQQYRHELTMGTD